ncbi:MAG: glycosyltransferase family 4 protein [Actinomycetota bacterium]
MERATADQMAHLRRHGWNFSIVSRRPWGAGRDLFTPFDPESEACDYRGRFGWRTHREFGAALSRRASNAHVTWVVGTSLGALRAATSNPNPVVLSHHYHHIERSRDRLKWRAFYEACRKVRAITYPTAFTMAEALHIAPWLSGRVHVVPNGIEIKYESSASRRHDRRVAREELGIPEGAFVVGNAGWLVRRKRFDVFLRVAAAIAAELPQARFEVCGEGPLESELKQLAQVLNLSGRVVFRGLVSDMETAYRAWDVCLFNSDFDTLPMTPLQAASFGCVVVASLTYGGLGEFLSHGENGVFLASHDIRALRDAVLRVATDESTACAWREAARATLATRFSPAACAAALDRVLRT